MMSQSAISIADIAGVRSMPGMAVVVRRREHPLPDPLDVERVLADDELLAELVEQRDLRRRGW